LQIKTKYSLMCIYITNTKKKVILRVKSRKPSDSQSLGLIKSYGARKTAVKVKENHAFKIERKYIFVIRRPQINFMFSLNCIFSPPFLSHNSFIP